MDRLHPLSRFVLTRWLCLCVLLLAGAAALLWKAGQGGMAAIRLHDCAGVFRHAALVAFGCATVGSLLTEDLLRYYGK